MERYRILLVDDDPDVRGILAAALRSRYEVVEADDGLEALHKLEDHEPDFAIIDAVMPMMDGFELCKAIRRHPDFQAIPVLFLSAFATRENIREGYAVGANLFMSKPIDPLRVLKNVEFTITHERPALRRKRYTIEALERRDEMERRREAEQRREAAEARREARRRPPPPEPPPMEEPEPEVPIEEPVAESSPRAEAEEPVEREAPEGGELPSEAAAGGRCRLLIIENEDDVREVMEITLRDAYEVTTARDGLEGIECVVQYQPDIILLDIMMPRMNGYQLLQSLRRNPAYRDLPVVVVSVKATQKDRDYAMRLGATDYLVKPFDPEELLRLLKRLVSSPGFEIRPKRLTIGEIAEREFLRRKEEALKRRAQEERERYAELRRIVEPPPSPPPH